MYGSSLINELQFNLRYYYYLYVEPAYTGAKRIINQYTGFFADDYYSLTNNMYEMVQYRKKYTVNEELFKKMRTGDIILFNTHGNIFADVVEFGTDSQYSHVAMILTPPHFNDKLQSNPNTSGKVLMLQSGYEAICTDVEDGKRKFGVQIVNFDMDYLNTCTGNMYWRPLLDSETGEPYFDTHQEEMNQLIKEAHDVIHNKPYDVHPFDFAKAWLDIPEGNNQLTNRYFCSALVAYMYFKMGFFPEPKDIHEGWDLVTPKMWSVDGKRPLPFVDGIKLGGQHNLKYEVYEPVNKK